MVIYLHTFSSTLEYPLATGTTDQPLPDTAATTETNPTIPQARTVALNKPLVILGMILATALSALDSTVVATAMPTIVGELNGLPLYSLVIAAYLLTATTTVPVYGKLADMYGRKPIFMFGAGAFIVGSALCGLAWDMPSLIAFRAVQGLGAGAVLPISLTIIGDLFSIEERARISGVFGSVWGISSVVGPVIGGAIVQFFDWRWVFFINVPVGIFAALLLFLYLREPHIHTRQKVDIAGAITLTVGAGMALVALQSGGRDGGWLSPQSLVIWAGAILLLALFIYFERRAVAPVLSIGLLSRPVIAVACMAGLLAGGVLIGYAAYLPLLAQGAWGGTPIEAGLVVAPLSIGWPIASALTGRLLKRYGYRPIVIVGMLLLLVGCLMLPAVQLPFISQNPILRTALVLISSLVAGAGLGSSTTSMLIAVQSSVPWSERGIATASVQFFRNMGNAVAAALLGAVLTATLAPTLATERVQALVRQMPPNAVGAQADPALGPVNALFNLDVRPTLSPEVTVGLSEALAGSLLWVFIGIAAMAAVGAVLATRFPASVATAEDTA
jgi:EmrB/QacA subfamily drug resistance transporter